MSTCARPHPSPAPPLLRVCGDSHPLPHDQAGGKAQTLAALARQGLRVPRGFCVATAAYEATLNAHGLAEAELALRSRLPAEDARSELDELLAERTLPADVRGALERELVALFGADEAQPLLAVRSSATGEDGSDHSFAGAHTSVLAVPCNVDALESALRSCWRSLWSPRAMAYRAQFQVAPGQMAVLVQELIEPEISAIVFTKDPVTDRDDHILVTCAGGIGETLMAGTGNGTTVTLDRTTREVLRVEGENIATRERWIPAIRQLGTLALLVERMLGVAVDVEAVHNRGRWTLVHARPVTT